jgi:hypothetical protein
MGGPSSQATVQHGQNQPACMLHVVVVPIACCTLAEFLIATVTGVRAHLYKFRRSVQTFFSFQKL